MHFMLRYQVYIIHLIIFRGNLCEMVKLRHTWYSAQPGGSVCILQILCCVEFRQMYIAMFAVLL